VLGTPSGKKKSSLEEPKKVLETLGPLLPGWTCCGLFPGRKFKAKGNSRAMGKADPAHALQGPSL
jgi:hypothetical protein